MVPNGCEIQLHLFYDLGLPWIDSLSVLVLDEVKCERSARQVDPLGHLELNFSNSQMLLGVVDCDHCIGVFVRVEDIFIEVDRQISRSFWTTTAAIANAAIAAATGQLSRVLQGRVSLEGNWWLMNHQHLLVLQVLLGVRVDTCLNTVFHISLWAIVMVLASPHERCRKLRLQIKLKRNGIITWIERSLERKASRTVVHDAVRIAGLSSLDSRLLIAISILVVLVMIVPVAALFLSFDSQFKVRGIKDGLGTDVNLAKHFVAWIIEWLVGFDVQVASVEL